MRKKYQRQVVAHRRYRPSLKAYPKPAIQKHNHQDAPAVANWNNYFFTPFTAVLRVVPALNAGALDALIFNGAPVCGLRPTRAARLRPSNVPKPTNAILSPFLSVLVGNTQRLAVVGGLIVLVRAD